jgi:4-amino-4-deoxychorismate lyase
MIRVNGSAADTVSALDRGLAYGDGVFRTLLCKGGQPLWWAYHYPKLARDCAALGLTCPREHKLADEVLLAGQGEDCAVKIVVTRGPGARGYRPGKHPQPTCAVISACLPEYPESFARDGIEVRVCKLRLGHQPALAGIKHLNRLENVLARMEWDDPAIAEGLLLDAEGWVIGGTMSNVFALRDGRLLTPRLDQCGVAGVTRERVMAAAPSLGLSVVETRLSLADLMAADEVMLTNSLIGIWRVARLGEQAWPEGPLVPALRECIEQTEAATSA